MIGKKVEKLDTEVEFKKFVEEQFDITSVVLVMQQRFMPQMVIVYQCKKCKELGIVLLGLPDIEEYLKTHEKINLREKAVDATIPCACNFPMEVLAYVFVIYIEEEQRVFVLGKHLQLKKTVAYFSKVISVSGDIVGICPQHQEIPEEKYSIIIKKIFNLYP